MLGTMSIFDDRSTVENSKDLSFRLAHQAWQHLLNLVLPGSCAKCQSPVDQAGALCQRCWQDMRFISEPLCPCCGMPFGMGASVGFDDLCGACYQSPPQFDRARAAFLYDDQSRSLILDFKHRDRTDLTPGFVQWLARAGHDLINDADMIVPVPLHWSRLFSRRYNQAAELARALASAANKDYQPRLLHRVKRTASQGHRSRRARWQNVQGAFQVDSVMIGRLDGRRVLLVDDVLTTGATANTCAAVLKKSGAIAVDLLTLARVPGPED